MNQAKTVLSQLMLFLTEFDFNKGVDAYNSNYRLRTFTCRNTFT